MILRGRLDGKQRNRLKGLLDMMYSPRQLGEEIGVDPNRVYMVYIPLGCPLERDGRGRILINGRAFASWYVRTYTKTRLLSDEAFCMTCRRAVKIVEPVCMQVERVSYILSFCPVCGHKISKITACKRGAV